MREDKEIREYSYRVERTCWLLIFFSMLTQVTFINFPSYNIAIGFWGAYCSFQKHGRATFGLIMFTFLSLIFDIIFVSVASDQFRVPSFTFCVTFFFLAMATKLYLLYIGAHFFAVIGGANSMATSTVLMDRSTYEVLDESQSAAFYSMNDNNKMGQSGGSLGAEEV